jgi:predicted DCC family thiol-disulfide oxidoreductase YuxK
MNAKETEGATKHLILYDGVCRLCNRWVGQTLPRDPKGLFHFASLQSDLGRSLLVRFGKEPDLLDTIYVLVDYKSGSPRFLARARAVLFVIRRLESPWRLLGICNILPSSFLDTCYSVLARNRYRLFGRYEQCLMPAADYASRFIDV